MNIFPRVHLSAFAAFLCLLVAGLPLRAQEGPRHAQDPVPVIRLTHPRMLGKSSGAPAGSFYKSKSQWQHIIDSTWGAGATLTAKRTLFDSYADALAARFDGFNSLGLNWDSLRAYYRAEIGASTSRGGFAAIMSGFAMSLRDGHTWALDWNVMLTPLAPGVPLLVLYAFATAEHFGAVLTVLPDSSALVLRTVPNHPLGLQPGDVILGYEGVPWKRLVTELIGGGLPVFSAGAGDRSAETHSRLRSVGNNWHLFETIDVVKYSTKDTMHLSVAPLLGLPADLLMPYEELEIPGIPASYYYITLQGGTSVGKPLDYGKLPGSDIGYIRLLGEFPTVDAESQFTEAVNVLWDSKGLMIDMRWNSGGWAFFNDAFARMFSQRLSPIEDSYRASASDFSLIRSFDSYTFQIPGSAGHIYDRPIAVLLGPTCVSMGDITAQRLRSHPMTRFFGKPTIASLGDNISVGSNAQWGLHHSISDMFLSSQPGVYLNRREFPIDEPVWFTPDDVARGQDTVVNRARSWINSLSYAHNVKTGKDTLGIPGDSLAIAAVVENPLHHALTVSAIITNAQAAQVDSTVFLDDGAHGDGAPGDGLWGTFIRHPAQDGVYYISVRTEDKTAGSVRRLPDVSLFTVVSTGIAGTVGDLPRRYSLDQNYPNPFNPATTIRYGLVCRSEVTLAVFNALGERVATLIQGEQDAGYHQVQFDGSRFSSGVYFCRLRAGVFTATRKIMLIR